VSGECIQGQATKPTTMCVYMTMNQVQLHETRNDMLVIMNISSALQRIVLWHPYKIANRNAKSTNNNIADIASFMLFEMQIC
jgi:hypothetical protein